VSENWQALKVYGLLFLRMFLEDLNMQLVCAWLIVKKKEIKKALEEYRKCCYLLMLNRN